MAQKKHRDKFVSKGSNFVSPVCGNCIFDNGDGTCRAFPEGIPEEILSGENKHTKPMYGQDNNITFKSKK